MKRRSILLGVLSSALAGKALGQDAASVDLVKVTHGFPAGGTADVTARLVSEKLRGSYAKAAIVESRTGAGGRIAIDVVKASRADGGTLLLTPMSTMAIYPHVFRSLSYNPFKDLAPVSLASTFALGLAIGPAVPASVTTLAGLLDWIKSNPAQAVYGSPSAGTSPHFLGAQISQLSGIKLVQVPYRGSIPGVTDLIGGQIPLMITSLGDFLPYRASGKLRIIACSEATRSRFAPDVPTLAESGFPSIMFSEWLGLFAPAKTPPRLVALASASIRSLASDKEARNAMGVFGLEPKTSSPEELGALMRSDFDRWAPIIKATGFTADS
jgi:tripartite-type tricarboxylate transporter receptor subunit TctC